MKITTIAFISIMLVAAVFLSGCTSAPEEDAAITEINIGYQPSTHQIAHMTAMEKGWWAEDLAPFGVEAVNEFEFPTGAPEMQAMLAGELDVAYVGAAPVISALATGLDAKIVAAVNTQGSDLVLRPEVPYESPEDLKGLTIATFPPGTIQDTLFRDWLIENGIDPVNDLEIKAMGPGPAKAAIAAGQVDGVFLPHPSPTFIEAEGNGRTVLASGEIMPDHPCCVLVVSGDLIRNNPEMVEQIIMTHIKAIEYDSANLEEASETYGTKLTADQEIVLESLEDWDGVWSADPRPLVDSTVEYANIQYELGFINEELTAEDIFDVSFYEAVSEE
ncbi:ABC transporter substrate-binding protein [Methanococcoides methylutens]|uniref:ABC-type nitrate/sulfonate/bicarbonate transport systems, periplasmic component n=1 Tax=Methanococcoides methylutens MM1 TaxID=1434104 RepID=A0A0E3WZL1_METMT|nr:ABC transporter substrate-binding protein [Methanococcoides methylutens]AKB84379.1 ABC-type nitrate/sulfonate/bicarbonate transport systems, periplasmic component [Methanococcoides methylutens MM1]